VQVPEKWSWKSPRFQTLVRSFLIEVLVYAVLVVAYFYLILQLLGEPLKHLFDSNLTWYAIAALGLIVAQGAVLEFITSFLLRRLGLDRLE
jgi:hypothetical protein